jgi:hypothetical protein
MELFVQILGLAGLVLMIGSIGFALVEGFRKR